jgi:hypothetical protein
LILDFEFDQHLESHKHVISIIMGFRDAGCYKHVLEQDGKTEVVQPITTKPSVGSEGGVGVVIHLSKTREKQINILSIEQRQQTKTPNKPR